MERRRSPALTRESMMTMRPHWFAHRLSALGAAGSALPNCNVGVLHHIAMFVIGRFQDMESRTRPQRDAYHEVPFLPFLWSTAAVRGFVRAPTPGTANAEGPATKLRIADLATGKR